MTLHLLLFGKTLLIIPRPLETLLHLSRLLTLNLKDGTFYLMFKVLTWLHFSGPLDKDIVFKLCTYMLSPRLEDQKDLQELLAQVSHQEKDPVITWQYVSIGSVCYTITFKQQQYLLPVFLPDVTKFFMAHFNPKPHNKGNPQNYNSKLEKLT